MSILAEARIRTLTLRGERPGPQRMGLEVTWIQRRLSVAAVKAAHNCLLGRVSQVGDRSGLAAKRRELQRMEEQLMTRQGRADRAVRISGQKLVKRGMFWSG